ncbi:MAG: Uma2 family endonuclease [Abditibacteriales bacterium]|nr:Uma2 family endonuclease [Abditibacteriales bacterium]MDW8364510.1 Uma2 family endonuclease [Abditibacteriales bacterium]
MESSWHRAEINLLIETLRGHWQGRQDYYAGGNMFIYYTSAQAKAPKYRGPDFYVVLDVDGSYARGAWVVWEENGRYPDVIVELLSPSTATEELTTKKALYERTFRTPEYYCYDPDKRELRGWQLVKGRYKPLKANERGWLWSERLGLWLGLWEGRYLGEDGVWLRFYTADGKLLLTFEEQAEQERQRAQQERQRAERLEAELAQLREQLRQQQG